MKKRTISLVAILSVSIISVTTANAYQDIAYDTLTVSKGINIYVDNTRVSTYDVNGNETEAMIYNGTTYLPVRGISEVLGYEVSWNGDERIVEMTSPANSIITPTATSTAVKEKYSETISTTSINGIKIDGKLVTFTDVNGKAVEPFVENGTTYIPVRGASEALGEEIGYKSNGNQVHIYIGDQPVVEVSKPYPNSSDEFNELVNAYLAIKDDPRYSLENTDRALAIRDEIDEYETQLNLTVVNSVDLEIPENYIYFDKYTTAIHTNIKGQEPYKYIYWYPTTAQIVKAEWQLDRIDNTYSDIDDKTNLIKQISSALELVVRDAENKDKVDYMYTEEAITSYVEAIEATFVEYYPNLDSLENEKIKILEN